VFGEGESDREPSCGAYFCQTANPLLRSRRASSFSLFPASSNVMGLYSLYSDGRSRTPCCFAYFDALKLARCCANRSSGVWPVMPTYKHGLVRPAVSLRITQSAAQQSTGSAGATLVLLGASAATQRISGSAAALAVLAAVAESLATQWGVGSAAAGVLTRADAIATLRVTGAMAGEITAGATSQETLWQVGVTRASADIVAAAVGALSTLATTPSQVTLVASSLSALVQTGSARGAALQPSTLRALVLRAWLNAVPVAVERMSAVRITRETLHESPIVIDCDDETLVVFIGAAH